MDSTNDARIRQSAWVVNPSNPLMEYKIFTARMDNLLYYIKAERGITRESLDMTKTDVQSVVLKSMADIEDNSASQYELLRKFLNSPVK